MPLRVVAGQPNAGKTGQILEWALEGLGSGQAATLIVPNLADVRRLQTELSGKAPLGIRVATAGAFAGELWQLHGDGRRIVGGATRSAIIRRLLADSPSHSMNPTTVSKGFERLVLRAARDCPAHTRSDLSRSPESLRVLLSLLQSYREELARLGLIECGWIGSFLADLAPRTGFVGALHFVEYVPAQIDLLVSLAAHNTVGIAVVWERGMPATRANDSVANALIGRAEVVVEKGQLATEDEIACLADRVGRGTGTVRSSGRVVLGEARGIEGEARVTARIARRAVDAGIAPERIAIVFPRCGNRANTVRTALATEDLKAQFDYPVTVGATGFGHALGALLRVALGRGARTDALRFLQSAYAAEGLTETAAVASRLDRAWRRNRRGEDSRAVFRDLCELRGSAGRVAGMCRDLRDRQLDKTTATEWQNLTDALVSTAARARSGFVSREDAGAHGAVVSAVTEMASVPGSAFSAADLLDALPTLVCRIADEETPGRVQVVQASSLGSRRFDAVIVGGLTEVEMAVASRDTFVSEVEELVLGLRHNGSDGVADLEFYSLVSRARRLVAFVRQTQTSEGVPRVASPAFEEVVRAYGVEPGEPGSGDDLPIEIVREHDLTSTAPVFTRGRRLLRTGPQDMLPPVRTVGHGAIDSDLAASAAVGRVFSATEIEAYIRCPYRWFYSRVLRPAELDVELDAAALGSHAHGLIAKFYRELAAQGTARVTPERLPGLLVVFDRIADEASLPGPGAVTLGEQIDAARARAWARRIVEDDAHWLTDCLPVAHEIEFGRETVIEFAGAPIAGRIDRVDEGPAGLVVTDYKSTRDVGKLVKPDSGGGIQHVVYACAAEKILDRPVVASVYRSLRSREMRGYWRSSLIASLPDRACERDAIDEQAHQELLGLVVRLVGEALAGMRSGRVPREPRSDSECRFCALKPLCDGGRR